MANRNPRNQWVKGQSGNPKGSPKKEWSWASVLQEASEEAAKDGQPIKYHIARSLIREALKGNVQAIDKIMTRMDGMPKQDIGVDGNVTISFHPSLKQEGKEDAP